MAAALSACLMLPAMTGLSTAAGGARVSVHDPSIVKDKSTYYVFGSHIDAAKSSDLQNWKRFSNGYATTNNVEFGNLSQNLKKACTVSSYGVILISGKARLIQAFSEAD